MTEAVPRPHPDEAQSEPAERAIIPSGERPHLRIEQPSSSPGEPGTQIEVFTGATRISGPFFRIEVQGSGFSYEARRDRTVLSGTGADDRRLLFGVRSDGAVLFRADPVTAEAPQTQERRPTGPSPAEAVPDTSTAPQKAPQTPSVPLPPPVDAAASGSAPTEAAAPDTPADEAEPSRAKLTGRLGRDPSFRTTAGGVLVARFPLAVHQEDGQTAWHNVLVFGDRAAQLRQRVEQGELAQGREVDVVGYVHTKERQSKSGGQPRRTQQIHAVAITRRGAAGPDSAAGRGGAR